MNDDLRRIFEMVAAINTRLEVSERSIKQIDQQLALLNLKREEELNDFRAAMKNLADAIAELKKFRAAESEMRIELAAKIENSARSTAAAIEGIQASLADNSAITKAVEEIKIAARNTVKADDFVTVRMALQNSAVSINDVKKRIDGIKFDTNKRFNELSVNSEINQQAIMSALAEIKKEITAPEVPAARKPEQDFEVSGWWNGNKER